MKLFINATPHRITNYFLKVISTLLLLHIVTVLVMIFNTNKTILNYFSIFYFDSERNLPSTYSALAILFCSFLLLIISKLTREYKNANYWLLLSAIFLFLSIDEYTSIHEQAGHILRIFTQKEFPFQGWYIPVAAIFSGISIFFVKFFFGLPKSILRQFIIAGIVFVIGAIGFEILSGIVLKEANSTFTKDIILYTLITIEELLEMIGIVIFIDALLKYLTLDDCKYNIELILKDK